MALLMGLLARRRPRKERRDSVRTRTHLDQINEVVPPSAQGCEECLICGHVGCCDSSKNQHATGTCTRGHPIVRFFEPGKYWRWCYVTRCWYSGKDRESMCAIAIEGFGGSELLR